MKVILKVRHPAMDGGKIKGYRIASYFHGCNFSVFLTLNVSRNGHGF